MMSQNNTFTEKLERAHSGPKAHDRFYPWYFLLMGFVFTTVLILSAANDFLFFGYLCLTMPLVMGLMAIHLVGMRQVKRNQ